MNPNPKLIEIAPCATPDCAKAALSEILRTRHVPLVAQDIAGPGLTPERRWIEVMIRPLAGKEPVDPTAIVHLAEAEGHGLALDEVVLAQALRWVALQRSIQRVAINLTHETLASSKLSGFVLSLLDRAGVDPRVLCLEVSELYPLRDVVTTRTELARLRRHGVSVALDDIGAGHANLRLCSGALIDVGKIDRQILWDAMEGVHDTRLLAALAQLCRRLNMEVVIEGVESEAALKVARELGSVFVQGYHVALPKRVPLEVVR